MKVDNENSSTTEIRGLNHCASKIGGDILREGKDC